MTVTEDRKVTELPGPPSLGQYYASAAARAALPGGSGRSLPATELVRRGVTVEQGHLADYARVCGFRVGNALPVTYPHMLTFPLQVVLMAGRSFPLPLPGLVHIANRITVHRAIAPTETLDVRVWAQRFTRHPKGAQVDLVGEVSADGETVWSGRSTYLARGAKAPDGPAGGNDTADTAGTADIAEPPVPTGPANALWRVPGDIGRRYAAVSGDVNPIHLHSLTAKAMGFPRAIAHGMWTAAHAVAALEGRIPDACTYDVVFRKPVLLPAKVELVTGSDAKGAWGLALRSAKDAEKLHLVGRISG
ncbi:Acyl dehydratase [Pseudonocardia sp. Ae406_Ps2]|uniref:MaoC family dehydratase n=1 Tax=unclassified Pseudonocardia TaxID=2619320 RepID=UPI00094B3608|nr:MULTISPECIES: MaoC/PaaZ C-terminal domain-containing protein [unclassified Pseudonocardia]OLL98158.1 Acyl dehydratase [Pseudonocardia sp. Ae331_Ps2]OLM25685.1 Acyl dehydratase [Pseudonocardia sp. Ae706_Ps2]OLM34164.1 Acyl dehydratase [Pseudonocardia sp. Ae717_Ps2]OLM04134.1 Acyl dehydratase [Pseudonocardia sp. Ae406_Ps2]OLM11038.1 Acyl dehydratase [Pseudonocardia sp. Ae505_Ps2]